MTVLIRLDGFVNVLYSLLNGELRTLASHQIRGVHRRRKNVFLKAFRATERAYLASDHFTNLSSLDIILMAHIMLIETLEGWTGRRRMHIHPYPCWQGSPQYKYYQSTEDDKSIRSYIHNRDSAYIEAHNISTYRRCNGTTYHEYYRARNRTSPLRTYSIHKLNDRSIHRTILCNLF